MRSLRIVFFLCLMQALLFGQPENPNTPDPTVTNYSKYADIEPNLYNGATSVPLPIATVNEGPLSVPVSLSYHTAGIRAHEMASSVGLGWALFAGGAITRRVRGLPDESENGYINTGLDAQSYGINSSYDNQFRDDVIDGDKDGEADVFSFSIGGLSGQFAFDEYGTIHQIQESDLIITSTELVTDEVINFKIIDTKGTQYFFGPLDAANKDDYRDKITYFEQTGIPPVVRSYFTTWHLRKIVTHDNAHSIDFSYTPDTYSYYSLQDCSFYGGNSTCEMGTLQIGMEAVLPSSITTSTSDIYFDYFTDRADIVDVGKRLYRIREVEGSRTVNYNLHHSYFEDTNSNAIPSHLGITGSHHDELKKRLKLDSLSISGGSESMPAYRFRYYGKSVTATNGSFFPSQVSQAIDHWGYYNDETDNNDEDHIIPETTITWVGGGSATGGLASIDRTPNVNGSVAGSLSRITYPLGGYTDFSYELNEYFEPDTIIENTFLGGVINSCTAQLVSYGVYRDTISYNEKLFGEVNLSISPVDTCDIGWARVRIYKNGSQLHNVFVDGSNISNSLNIQSSQLQAGEEYEFRLYVYRGAANLEIDVHSVGTNEWCGGLRLKTVNTYDNNSFAQIRRDYTYTMDDGNNSSSGVLYRQPKYGMRVATPALYLDSVFSTNSILPLQSFEGYHVGYTTANVDYNGNGSKRIYYYNDLPVQDDDISFPPPPEEDREFVGQLRSQHIYREDDTELNSRSVIMEGGFDQTTGSKMVHVRKLAQTAAVEYYIHSGRYLADSVVTISEGIQTITDYNYSLSQHLFPTVVTVADEFGQELSWQLTEYTDAYAEPGASSAEANYLYDKNIITPWRIRSYDNGIGLNIGTTTTLFDMYSGIARPTSLASESKLNTGGATSTITDFTDFKTYDSKGNITALRKPGNLTDHTYEYYSNSLLKKSCFGTLCSSFEYDDSNTTRLLSKKTAVDGTSMSYDYDGLKRLKQSKDDQTLAQTNITYHLSNSAKSYTKSIASFQADPLSLSSLLSLENRSYVDGLGRPIQTVGVNQLATGGDQITAQSYDDQGRVNYSYETIGVSGNNGAYVTPQLSWDRTETIYEASPLNRVSSVTPPSWHPTQSTFGVNSFGDQIIDHINGGFYADSILFKRTTIDGNGNQTISFTDVRGRLILNRRANSTDTDRNDTYYIYDDKNQLTQVIPPGSTMDDPNLNYYYSYDAEGKTISKKVPSKGWIDYVYDSRDLMIAQQDSFLEDRTQWYVYEHDAFNRSTDAGFQNIATAPTASTLNIDRLLSRTVYGVNSNETSFAKPITTYTKNLDTDDWLIGNLFYDAAGRNQYSTSNNHMNLSAVDSTIYHFDGASNVVKSRHRIHDASNDPTIIEDYQTIDNDGRTIAHWMSVNGVEQQLNFMTYDAEDQLLSKQVGISQSNFLQQTDYDYLPNGLLRSVNGGTAIGTDLFGYHMNYDTLPSISNSSSGIPQLYENGNISSIQWSTIGEPTTLNVYQYDYLDRLTHSYTNDNLYNTEYGYDARGNFDHIKRYADVDSVATLIDDLDPSYVSGNANQMLRMNESASSDKGYKSNSSGDYTYDGNGNMISDPEKGITMSYNHLDLVDTITWDDGRQLIFTYDALGALLTQTNVDSTEIKKQDYLGIIEYMEGYPYIIHHAEGRVVNQGVEAFLKYLYLDHNQEIDGSFGAQRVESTGAIMDSTTMYEASQEITLSAGFEVYTDAAFTAEIITVPTYQEDWQWQYTITDHLGNLRMVYSDLNGNGTIDGKEEIIQETNYYPYGMRHSNYERTALKNNYQYNGIEHVGDFGLDLNMATYRSLDAAIATWGQIDPAAEKYYGLTPYNSMGGNPISYTDTHGDDFGLTAMIAIGAATGVFSNGLANASNGQGFFDGALGAAAWGGVSAAASFGIGQAFQGTGGFLKELGRAGAHGLSSGLQSELSGGSFGQGFLAGGISSGLGSGAAALSFGDAAMIGVGGLGGGIGSAIGGGNFFDGLGQGIAVGAFNHSLHKAFSGGPGDPPTKEELKQYLAGEFLEGRITKEAYINSISLVDDGPWGLFKQVASNNRYELAATAMPVGRLGMLGRYFASLAQLGQSGKIIATTVRDAPRLVAKYGGRANDWRKMTSTTYKGRDGFKFSTHWYQNVTTGARVEYKTVLGR